MKVLITDAEGNDVVLTLSYPDENGMLVRNKTWSTI